MNLIQKWEDAGLSNDFVFSKVMIDPKICQEVIQRVLPELKIDHIKLPNSQEEINFAPDAKGVRFDVFTRDTKNNCYDIEMQVADEKDLLKRAQYYQAMTSLDSYEKGKNYQEANNSYVIFFCCFDPLGLGLQQYTIHRHVDESPEHIADDGTTTIFLNIPSLRKDVNQPLQKFLDVIANRKVDGDDRFIVQLKKRIAFVKHNKKWRAEYMRLSLYEMDRRHGLKVARQEGIQEGIEEGKEEAILQVTSLFIKQQLLKENIIANLKEAYDLTDEEAEQYYKRCLK